jgi:hypothetical protein
MVLGLSGCGDSTPKAAAGPATPKDQTDVETGKPKPKSKAKEMAENGTLGAPSAGN